MLVIKLMFLSLENFCFWPDCGRLCTNLCMLSPFGPYNLCRTQTSSFRFFHSPISSPVLALCGLRTSPCLSLLWWVTPVPPHTCAAPRSPQEFAGACNRLCRGYWVLRLTETSQPHSVLDAEWSSAWGGSPNCGRCQIPTVAPRNHSHTDADTSRRGGDGGGGGGVGTRGVVVVLGVWAGQCRDMEVWTCFGLFLTWKSDLDSSCEKKKTKNKKTAQFSLPFTF